jgi:hypothetical protein
VEPTALVVVIAESAALLPAVFSVLRRFCFTLRMSCPISSASFAMRCKCFSSAIILRSSSSFATKNDFSSSAFLSLSPRAWASFLCWFSLVLSCLQMSQLL